MGQVGAGSPGNFGITYSWGKEKFPGRVTKEMQRSVCSSQGEQGPESESAQESSGPSLPTRCQSQTTLCDIHDLCYVSQGQDATEAKQKALPFPGEPKI